MTRSEIGGVARWIALTAGVFVLASGGFPSSGITESEFECEQTAAHLQTCCPDFPVTELACDHVNGCGYVWEPFFDVPTSRCLQRMSCEDLRTSGKCDRLAKLVHESVDAGVDEEPTPKEDLCP